MKQKIFIALIIFISFKLFAQQPTLNTQSSNLPDLPASSLYDSAFYYCYTNPQLSIDYSSKAIQKFDQMHRKEIGELYFNIGRQLIDLGQYDVLPSYADSLIKLADKQSFELLRGHASYFRAYFFTSNNKNFLAQNELNNAIIVYNNLNSAEIIEAYSFLGENMLYSRTEDKSLEYYEMALTKMNYYNPSNIVKLKLYSIYALVLTKLEVRQNDNNLDKIHFYNEKAKELIKKGINHPKRLPLYIQCVDLFYNLKKNNLVMAKINAEGLISLVPDEKRYLSYCFTVIPLIQYYLHPEVHNLDKAEYYCHKIISLCKDKPIKDFESQAYKFLANIAYQKKEYDKIIPLSKIADSIFIAFLNEKNVSKVIELEGYFNNYSINMEKEKAIKENKLQKSVNLMLVLTLCFLLVILILFYYLYKQSKGFNRLLEEKNNQLLEQKDLLVQQTENLNLLNKILQNNKVNLQNSLINFEESNKKLESIGFQLSHDLREPVRMIVSFSQIIYKKYADRFDAKGLEYLGFIKDSGDRLNKMILEILQNAQKTKRLDTYNIDLSVILEISRMNLIEKIARTKTIIEAEKLPHIEGYESEMIQLFMNIIDNAIKYKKEDVPPKLSIKCQQEYDKIILSFTDNGKGIEADKIDTIFDLFKTSNYGNDSYGIGLNSCISIVKEYDGTIKVNSELGQGTTFIVTLGKKRNSTTKNASILASRFEGELTIDA